MASESEAKIEGRMNPAISILLPSIRSHLLPRAFNCISAAAGCVPYEVVVVADFEPQVLQDARLEHVEWMLRERQGVVDAVNVAEQVARGEYLFLFNDESVLESKALEILYYEGFDDPWRVLSPRHLPEFNFTYYGKKFAPFMFVRQD